MIPDSCGRVRTGHPAGIPRQDTCQENFAGIERKKTRKDSAALEITARASLGFLPPALTFSFLLANVPFFSAFLPSPSNVLRTVSSLRGTESTCLSSVLVYSHTMNRLALKFFLGILVSPLCRVSTFTSIKPSEKYIWPPSRKPLLRQYSRSTKLHDDCNSVLFRKMVVQKREREKKKKKKKKRKPEVAVIFAPRSLSRRRTSISHYTSLLHHSRRDSLISFISVEAECSREGKKKKKKRNFRSTPRGSFAGSLEGLSSQLRLPSENLSGVGRTGGNGTR
ncbi:hypothetical protein PUN28_017341 [Cardiocondyla obscurior]|uniref:Transmembrane protein n=1 Tax=Cardiocondyla obscurior TaxID=286306 RepID=A0AAW2ELE1_9HYME